MKRSEVNAIITDVKNFLTKHRFELPVWADWSADDWKGKVLIGEVSLVNDDENDNRFYDEVGRFPEIEEDVKPVHLLVNDYLKYM